MISKSDIFCTMNLKKNAISWSNKSCEPKNSFWWNFNFLEPNTIAWNIQPKYIHTRYIFFNTSGCLVQKNVQSHWWYRYFQKVWDDFDGNKFQQSINLTKRNFFLIWFYILQQLFRRHSDKIKRRLVFYECRISKLESQCYPESLKWSAYSKRMLILTTGFSWSLFERPACLSEIYHSAIATIHLLNSRFIVFDWSVFIIFSKTS